MNTLHSAFPEIPWPAIVSGHSASLLAVMFQLEMSQWWTPERLAQEQFSQLVHVVAHAQATVPFYQRRFAELGIELSKLITPEGWRQLPLLSRRDIQLAGTSLHSSNPPPTHGRVTSTLTSGSTNQPVRTLGTELAGFFWRAITLRDHIWHQRDFGETFAAIRYTGDNEALPPDGRRTDNWGSATAGLFATGPAFLLNVRSSLEEQADWLARVNPGYLLGYPSVLLGIAQHLERQGRRLPRLRELRTFGEILEPECRAVCQRVFGVKTVDMYSSQEVGYLGLQCSEHEHYHVMSENVLVEVLDEQGQPCGAGETGRVVVSTLHNFAMPLLRYDIGDYAEVGQPCSCGRGLPTLRRILGRQRNLLVLPNGERRWPIFDAGERPEDLPLFYQFQIIQRSLSKVDVNVVRDADLSPHEADILKRYVQQMLGHPFEVAIARVAAIPRNRTGKFEDFISEVSSGGLTS
jgi:phenylacetate-CoA ligase